MKLMIAAMQEEVQDLMGEYQQIIFHPFEAYIKEDTILAVTGIGKVNAAFVLTQLIHRYPIEQIINLGFAGATKPFKVGDRVIIKQCGYHDFDLSIFGYEKGQVPRLPRFFKSNENLVQTFSKQLVGIKSGTLYSGDYFMTSKLKEEPYITDMEGAALYQVAYLTNIPIIAIKIISDIIDTKDQFDHYQKFESKQGAKLIRDSVKKLLEVKL